MRLTGTPSTPGPGSLAGLLAGVAHGTRSITLVFLGMRAVMEIGGACADGGPYVSARPCPEAVSLAMVGGTFGMFGAAGLLIWFGSRFGARCARRAHPVTASGRWLPWLVAAAALVGIWLGITLFNAIAA